MPVFPSVEVREHPGFQSKTKSKWKKIMRGTGLPHEFTSKKIMAKLRLKVPGTWAGECEKKMGLNNKAEIELTIS